MAPSGAVLEAYMTLTADRHFTFDMTSRVLLRATRILSAVAHLYLVDMAVDLSRGKMSYPSSLHRSVVFKLGVSGSGFEAADQSG